MTDTQHLAIIPRDGFFCKDGRGWHTSSSGRGHALDWPWPSTILGALRTASGRDRENEKGFTWQQTRDVSLHRLLALRRPLEAEWSRDHRVWPTPQDALWIEAKVEEGGIARRQCIRLNPQPRDKDAPRLLGRNDDGLREALWFPDVEGDGKPLSPPRWWSDGAFVAWLTGQDPSAFSELSKWGEKPIRRVQTRVALNPETLTAEDAMLFSHDVIETLDRFEGVTHEWAFCAEVLLPQKLKQRTLRLGSDSRLAWNEEMPAERDLFEAPEVLLKAFEKGSPGLRLVVVTPAKFQDGWLPSGFMAKSGKLQGQLRGIANSDVELCAAFLPRPLHVSGWNMAGGGRGGTPSGRGAPKETQRLVAPGAVYFFRRANGQPFTREDADRLWLAAMGARTAEGFGLVVPGVWNSSETQQAEQISC